MDYTGCRALSNEEIDILCSAFGGKYRLRDRAIFQIGIFTGFRISEILSLKICDVLRNGEVRESVTVNKAWMKGRKESRTTPLHSCARAAIRDWIDSLHGENQLAESPLFPRQGTNMRLSPKTYWTILKSAASKAGVPTERIGTHSMRKSFASRMWHSPFVNGDIAKMARLLGHRDPTNTLRYIEFMDGSLEMAVLAA